MRKQTSTWRRAVAGLVLGLGLAANTGCASLDYTDWKDLNDAIFSGAVDGTGSFVEASWNALLTSFYQGLTGMSDG